MYYQSATQNEELNEMKSDGDVVEYYSTVRQIANDVYSGWPDNESIPFDAFVEFMNESSHEDPLAMEVLEDIYEKFLEHFDE